MTPKETFAKLSFDTVVWVGAGEMNRRKGHNYLKDFADLLTNRVLFATPEKDASVWREFTQEFVWHNGHPKAIQDATIGMSAAYPRGMSNNLGNARVVDEEFHAIQNVVEASN